MPEDEIAMIKQKLDDHIDSYNIELVRSNDRWDMLLKVQEQNAKTQEQNVVNISKLTIAMEIQADASRGLIEAWQAANTLHKLVKWLSTFSILGIAVAWCTAKSSHITSFFN